MSGGIGLYDRRDRDTEVARAVTYIKDDGMIAAFYGVKIAVVQAARAKHNLGQSRQRVRQQIADGVPQNSYGINDSGAREAAKASCVAHLKALLRYGACHDGLAGLPADRFRALAHEHDITLL